MQEQTIDYEGIATLACVATSTCSTGATTTVTPIVVVSKNPVCYADTDTTGCRKSGWALNLTDPVNGAQGERVVSSPIIRQGYVLFTTLIPNVNPCESGGTSHFMEVGALSGGASGAAPFGVNGDSKVYSNDLVTVTIGGISGTYVASGIDLGIGIINMPAIIETPTVAYKYFKGSTGKNATLLEPPLGGHRSWRQLK